MKALRRLITSPPSIIIWRPGRISIHPPDIIRSFSQPSIGFLTREARLNRYWYGPDTNWPRKSKPVMKRFARIIHLSDPYGKKAFFLHRLTLVYSNHFGTISSTMVLS